MNTMRLCTAVLMCLGVLEAAGCSSPLDLCADQSGACLTVEVTSDSMVSADLLRALYTVSPGAVQERQFAGQAGAAALPLGFELVLPMAGMVNVDVIAESALQPVLHGSAQTTLAPSEHQLLTVPLTADLSNLPYVGPPPRHHAGIVFAPAGPASQSIIMFGGTRADGTVLDDTWALDATGTTWTQTSAGKTSPASRNCTLAYDQTMQRVVVAGGSTATGSAVQDMWTYDLTTATWTLQPNNFGGGNRIYAGMTVTDAGTAIIAGGQDPTGVILQDILTSTSPGKPGTFFPDFMPHTGSQLLPKVKAPKLVYVTATSGLYVIGADEATLPTTGGITLWEITGAVAVTSSPLSVVPVAGSEVNSPSRRSDYSVAVDSAAGLIYLFGGISTQGGQYLRDAYVYDVSLRQWAMISPSTPAAPLPRAGAQLVLLPSGLQLFGGLAAPASPTTIALDSWKLVPSAFATPTVSGVYTRHL
jgi:hypothetical protein